MEYEDTIDNSIEVPNNWGDDSETNGWDEFGSAQDESEEGDELPEEGDSLDAEDEGTETTTNTGFDTLKAWADGRGITVNPEDYKEIEFNDDFIQQESARLMTTDYLTKFDPSIATLVAEGVTLQDYMQREVSLLATPDNELVLNHHIQEERSKEFERLNSLGKLKGDAEGNLTAEERALIERTADARAKSFNDGYSEQDRKEYAQYLRNMLRQQIPQAIKEQAQAAYQAQLEQYEVGKQQVVQSFVKDIADGNTLFKLSPEQQKDLQERIPKLYDTVEHNGQQVPYYYHKMATDPKVMLAVSQVIALQEAGFFSKEQAKLNHKEFKKLLDPKEISSKEGITSTKKQTFKLKM